MDQVVDLRAFKEAFHSRTGSWSWKYTTPAATRCLGKTAFNSMNVELGGENGGNVRSTVVTAVCVGSGQAKTQ